MEISQNVCDYAAKLEEIKAGMAEKSAEFREKGSKVYLREPAETEPAVPL